MAKVNHRVKSIVIARRKPTENKLRTNDAMLPNRTISLRLLAGALSSGDRTTPSGRGLRAIFSALATISYS